MNSRSYKSLGLLSHKVVALTLDKGFDCFGRNYVNAAHTVVYGNNAVHIKREIGLDRHIVKQPFNNCLYVITALVLSVAVCVGKTNLLLFGG